MTALIIVLVVLFVIFWPRIVKRFYHRPAPAFIGRLLDSRLRHRRQPPRRTLERSGIKPGMKVLDLGCGGGALTTEAARMVGEHGKVYALDIQPAMLKQLERKLARPENQDIKNVELKLASAYDLPFEDESLDAVFMVAVLQEIPDRNRTLREIKRVLKPVGILAITEILPDPDYPLRSTTIKQCQREGFVLDASFGNFFDYTVRFKKPISRY